MTVEDGKKVVSPGGTDPESCQRYDHSNERDQASVIEREKNHDAYGEGHDIISLSTPASEEEKNVVEKINESTTDDEEWVSSSSDEDTVRSEANLNVAKNNAVLLGHSYAADTSDATISAEVDEKDNLTTIKSRTNEDDTAAEADVSVIQCDDHQSITSTLFSGESHNQQKSLDDGLSTKRDIAIDGQLRELFDRICELQDAMQQELLLPQAKEIITASILCRRASSSQVRRNTMSNNHAKSHATASKRSSRSASMPFVSATQINFCTAATQMESAANNLKRVFTAQKNIHDLRASLKSLESGYESSSVSESNYGAVDGHIAIGGGYSSAANIKNRCLLTVDGLLGFICSLIDWRESLETARELLHVHLKEAAIVSTENKVDPLDQHRVDLLGQQIHSMKETISADESILSYSSSLMESLFGSLKDCFLLLHKDPQISMIGGDSLKAESNRDSGASVVASKEHQDRCIRRINQVEKQLNILSKIATVLGGLSSTQNHSSSVTERQRNNYILAYFTLLELLQMATVLLQSNSSLLKDSTYSVSTDEDIPKQPLIWKLSDNLLLHWKNSDYWDYSCQLLSLYHDENTVADGKTANTINGMTNAPNDVQLTRDEGNISSIGSNFPSSESFDIVTVEHTAFLLLKQALATKLELFYDGRRTHIPPMHDFVKVSLADLRASCGWPDEREGIAMPPAVPPGARKVASRLKNGAIIGRENILEKLSLTLNVKPKVEDGEGDADSIGEQDAKAALSSSPMVVLYSAADERGEEDLRKYTLTFCGSSSLDRKEKGNDTATYEGGVYGVGKSTIISSIISQESFRRKYSGGIAWIEMRMGSFIGSNLKYASYCNYLQSICLQLDDGLVPDIPEFCRFVSQPGDEESTKIVKEKYKLEKAKDQMKNYLQQRKNQSLMHGENILLILDNIFDPVDLHWFQFTGNGCEHIHILATTQNRVFRFCCKDSIEVGFLSPHESYKLLLGNLDFAVETDTNSEAIDSIISSCKYHPLLLEAVGRWMNILQKNSKPISTIFAEVAISLSAMHHENIPLLFQIMDTTLSSLQNAPMSKLLKLCLVAKVNIIQSSGCFDDVYLGIPVSLMKKFWTSIFQNEDCGDILDDIAELHSGKDIFDLVIDGLELVGILERSMTDIKESLSEKDLLSFKHEVFRLYGFYLAKGGGEVEPITADTKEAWNKALVNQYLSSTFNCYEDYALCMVPRHMARVKLISQMEHILGDESFIHKRLSSFGCHQGTLMHLHDCAWLRNAAVAGDWENQREIEIIDEIVVHILEKVAVEYGKVLSSGEDVFLILDVVQAMHEIGVSLFDMGLPNKAFRYFKTGRQVLKYNKMNDGINELVAASKYSLAKIHIKAERHKKAMAYLEQAQHIWHILLGKESEYTAQISFHMGAIHAWFGHYRKAEACFEHALSVRRRNDDKPGICRTLAIIGYLHHKSGHLDEALQNYKEAMLIDDQSALEHLDLSVYWNRIGNIHTLKGAYEEAMDCFTKALENGGLTLDDENLDVADTLQNIAILCHFRGEHEDSLQCFDQALMIYRNKLGASHVKVGDLLYSMSSLYVDMNDYKNAQQALENSLRIRKQSFHEDHLDVAETLHLLGLVLVNLGDRKNAFPCFREALRIRKKVLGSGNALVADSIHTLGVFYKEINEYDKAIEYISRELKLRKKIESNDMQVAEILQLLGTLESLRHNHEESINYFRESLQLRKDLVGNDHLIVAETLAELGRVYAEKGDYVEAISQVNSCLHIRELNAEQNQAIIGESFQLLGKINAQFEYFDKALRCFEQALEKNRSDNDASAETLYFMGCVYYDMDLEDQALRAIEQSVELKKQGNCGDDGREILDAYAKIGTIYAHQSRYDESLENFNEFIKRSDLGDSPKFHEGNVLLQKGEILHKMAVIYNLKGMHDDAIDCELKVLQIYKSNLGDRDIRIADSLHNAGCFFSVAGKCQESLEYFEDAYRLRKLILGRNHEDVATTLYNAASSQNMMGNHTKALKCLKESLEIRQNTLGEHHEKVTMTLQRIAAVCREMGDISEAIRTYEEVLPALIEEVGNRDLRVSSILYALGNLEDDQGNYESAMRYFEDALSIRKQANSQEDVAACLSSMAFVHSNMKNEAKALECLNQALDIRKKVLGEEHELVSDTHNNLAFFCCSLGQPEEAKFHLWEALSIRKQCSAHQKVADTLNNLGNVHKDLHEYQLAIECYQEALRVREHSEIEGTADTYFNLGDLFVLKGDLDSATECYEVSECSSMTSK